MKGSEIFLKFCLVLFGLRFIFAMSNITYEADGSLLITMQAVFIPCYWHCYIEIYTAT